jgi:hypothetical protein
MITSTDPGTQLGFQATASNAGPKPWIFVAPNASQTPGSIAVVMDPTGLAVGTYAGTITISSGPTDVISNGLSPTQQPSLPAPFTIPVTLVVHSNTTVTPSTSTLNFSQVRGSSPPASQTVNLTSSATGATFTSSIPSTSNCSWLQISPASGSATGAVTVGVLSNSLAAGRYSCQVTLVLQNAAAQIVPITANLTVT